jgi:GDP-L-fucose synthase
LDRSAKLLMSAIQIDSHARVYVAGHTGMVGSAIQRRLQNEGFSNIFTQSSKDLDLRRRELVFDYLRKIQPEVVFFAAARVGGILANSKYPAEFLSDNLQIQLNLIDASHEVGVSRLIFLGSSCIYPRLAPQPMVEAALMTGPLEPTNDGYAIAKIAGIFQVRAMRRQFGHRWISVMPTNLYGPGDNYDVERSHVLPAMIRRYFEAAQKNQSFVKNWGTGLARREFLHVDDLAEACLFLLRNYDDDEHVNVGTGRDVTINELAQIVSRQVGYKGETIWDQSKPDGTPRKLLDVSKLNSLGWQARITLEEGVASAISDFKSRISSNTIS